MTCKADSTKWAVKIIEKSKIDPGDHSLQTEIDILCRVDQENCVCLKEWFDEPKRVLLVMEFVTGGTLFDRIVNNGRYNEEAGRKAFVELASGLAYLHEMVGNVVRVRVFVSCDDDDARPTRDTPV